jgi:hypothetical protein
VRSAPSAAKLPELVANLCKTLEARNVARYFIRNVPIGDTVALVDKKIGHTYRLRVEAHTIVVLSISKQQPEPTTTTMPVLFLFNSRIMQAYRNKVVAA